MAAVAIALFISFLFGLLGLLSGRLKRRSKLAGITTDNCNLFKNIAKSWLFFKKNKKSQALLFETPV
ncbi:MAG: hypothetical protein WC634_02050 [archaeon]